MRESSNVAMATPTFITLPYPFVEDSELRVDSSFPEDSYFSPQMADPDKVVQFIEASCRKSMDYLKWKDADHFFKALKMERNKK